MIEVGISKRIEEATIHLELGNREDQQARTETLEALRRPQSQLSPLLEHSQAGKCPMPRAILLKTKSVPIDPYDIAFREKTPFFPVFVPVLAHQRVNSDKLDDIQHHEPQT